MRFDLRKIIRNLPLKRGRAFLIRGLVKTIPQMRYESILLFGKAIKIDLRDNSSIKLFLNHSKDDQEPEIYGFLNDIIESNDVFWDVGANIGCYTLFLSDKCNIISFEPNYKLYSFLKESISNLLNVRIYNFALSNDNNKQVSFYINKKTSGLSSLINLNSNNGVEVISRTVDSLIKDDHILPPSIIKIDVEGYEYFVLKGFKGLNKFSPIIIFEYIEEFANRIGITFSDIVNLLGKHWSVFRFINNGKLIASDIDTNSLTNNYLAIHKSNQRINEIRNMMAEQ